MTRMSFLKNCRRLFFLPSLIHDFTLSFNKSTKACPALLKVQRRIQTFRSARRGREGGLGALLRNFSHFWSIKCAVQVNFVVINYQMEAFFLLLSSLLSFSLSDLFLPPFHGWTRGRGHTPLTPPLDPPMLKYRVRLRCVNEGGRSNSNQTYGPFFRAE